MATCYVPTQQVKGTLDIWCGGEKGQSSTVRVPSLTSSKEGGQPGVPGRISPGGLAAKAGVGVQGGGGGGDSGHSEIPVRAAWSEGNQLGPGTREWRDPRGTQRAVSHLAPAQPNNMAVEPRPQRG